MWKACGLFFCVSIVLLYAVLMLWQKNGILREQNCTLQRTLEVNIETAKKKSERNRKELERLSRELAVMAEADPAWSNSPLPATIAMQLRRLIKEHNSAIGASRDTGDSL